MPLYEGFLHGEKCPECRGIGKFRSKSGKYWKLIECHNCKGSGLVCIHETACSVCHGKGEEQVPGRLGSPIDVPCLKCWGTGVEPKDKREELSFIHKTWAMIEKAYC
jgi:DnaJ-class molecular chaperone